MPVLARAANTTINGGYFADVQGDQYFVQGDHALNEAESGVLALKDASALGATHDSFERHPPPKCQPGTRKTTLRRIDEWVEVMTKSCHPPDAGFNDQTSSTAQTSPNKIQRHERILWLHGPAGAGKSAVAQTVSETYAERGSLVGSFFFSRGSSGRDTAKHLFPTLTYQIAMRVPGLRSSIGCAVKSDLSIFEKSFDAQINHLIILPFQLLKSSLPTEIGQAPCLIILDGLDECGTKDVQCDILHRVADLLYKHDLPLCFLIVSRPESHIKGVLRSDTFRSHKIAEEVSLYAENNSDEAKLDIRAFLLAEFDAISLSPKHREFMKFVPTPWPPRDIIDTLVARSGGYFIYVATVIRFINEEFCHPVERLQIVLDASTSDGSPFAELDKLYRQILSTNPNRKLLLRILGYIFCIPSPPREVAPIDIHRTDVVEGFLGLQLGTVRSMLGGMHSLIRVEDTPKSFHASFLDFLIDKSRAGDFFIDIPKHHGELALNLLSIAGRWKAETTRLYEHWFFLSWSFHACNASDSSAILRKLEGVDVGQWEVIINCWQTPLPIISTLKNAISWLKRLEEPAQDQILRMNTMLDYAFQMRLRDCGWFLTLFPSAFNFRDRWRNFTDGLLHVNAATGYEGFQDLMTDARWSDFFCDLPTLHHACLALRYTSLLRDVKLHDFGQREWRLKADLAAQMRPSETDAEHFGQEHWVSQPNLSSLALLQKERFLYSLKYWTSHLFHSSPGSAAILDRLQSMSKFLVNQYPPCVPLVNLTPDGLPVVNYSTARNSMVTTTHEEDLANAQVIVRWLKKMPNPPSDLLQEWTPCQHCGKFHAA